MNFGGDLGKERGYVNIGSYSILSGKLEKKTLFVVMNFNMVRRLFCSFFNWTLF